MADIKPKLLIVDDDEEIRTQMKWALSRDFDLIMAGDRPEAIESFRRERPLTTLWDLGLPPQPNEPDEGIAALGELLSIDPAAKIIIISGQVRRKCPRSGGSRSLRFSLQAGGNGGTAVSSPTFHLPGQFGT
jgi:ActR/RegA family two-component response regulator